MAQTDNSFLSDKVAIRVAHLPSAESVRVLDCFAGKQVIWSNVKRITGKRILTLPIDTRKDVDDFILPGSNIQFLESLDLSRFDVIDLDDYGVPYEQLKIIFRRGYKAIVFVTFIQSLYGCMPHGLLKDIGFSETMINKIPTLFGKSGWKHFTNWLAMNGVKKISHRSHFRKHYLYFSCADESASGYSSHPAKMVVGHA